MNFRAWAVGVFSGEVFFGEVDVGFDAGLDFEQGSGEFLDAAGEFAVELAAGGTEGGVGAGANEVGNRFGLGEVEFSSEEGGAGEFAGLGGAAAAGEEIVEDAVNDEGVAVAGNFEEVFAGGGIWGGKERNDDLIEGFAL